MPLTLTSLNDDVLFSIVEMLVPTWYFIRGYEVQKLLSLSATCRQLRELLKPKIFENISWKYSPEEPLQENAPIPRGLWNVSRKFTLFCFCSTAKLENKDRAVIVHNLSLSFPHMTRLQCVVFANAEVLDEPWPELMTLVSSSPTLSAVEFREFPWNLPRVKTADMYQQVVFPTGLRRFVFSKSPAYSVYPVGTHYFEVSCLPLDQSQKDYDQGYSLLWPVAHNSLWLEELEMPGECSEFQELATYPWPWLRSLTLIGCPPLQTKFSQPLISFLAMTPSLSYLKLRLARIRNEPEFLIWPPEYDHSATFPQIKELIVSNPSARDGVWSRLPRSLRRLALLCHPHNGFGLERWRELNTESIPANQLLSILLQCPMSDLTTLRISFWAGSDDFTLLNHIPSASPNLNILEIHRYQRIGSRPEEVTDPYLEPDNSLERLCITLSPLRRLRTLLLDLIFTDTPTYADANPEHGDYDKMTAYYHKSSVRAEQIFTRLPWLKDIGFLHRDYHRARWLTFNATIDENGTVNVTFIPASANGRYNPVTD
ncbi:hypothetical protein B0H10DRAFT_1282209 [Mycena sp. CBHHK59/15]|nr:hypothetical protein B0H10DRAFT_1282209 [Mycena sp. CBHHK59/15]